MAWAGTVRALFLAPERGAPMVPVDAVHVALGAGIAGDRYEAHSGRRVPPDPPKGDLTLFEEEVIEAVRRDYGLDVDLSTPRRNVVTAGVPLHHLVDRDFRIGDVVVRGVELVEPCTHLERLTGIPNLRKALVHRAGLRADVVAAGAVRVGDSVLPG